MTPVCTGREKAELQRAAQRTTHAANSTCTPAAPPLLASQHSQKAPSLADYQLCEQLSSDAESTLYKARLKGSILFTALRSVSKSRRRELLVEVKVLRALDHGSVLRFDGWYETANHLWIVTEFCAGGRLSSLLAQDGRLPQSSVASFGLDVLAGMQHAHSRGFLLVDLRPTSMLIDESGILRIGGLSQARSLSDAWLPNAEKLCAALGDASAPSYVAPELLAGGGVLSFASDFWSFGCLLYEMAAGAPPFSLGSASDRANDVLNKALACKLFDDDALERLLQGLLAKRPLDRLQWQELRTHAFWGAQLETVAMPEQRQFDDWQRLAVDGVFNSASATSGSSSNSGPHENLQLENGKSACEAHGATPAAGSAVKTDTAQRRHRSRVDSHLPCSDAAFQVEGRLEVTPNCPSQHLVNLEQHYAEALVADKYRAAEQPLEAGIDVLHAATHAESHFGINAKELEEEKENAQAPNGTKGVDARTGHHRHTARSCTAQVEAEACALPETEFRQDACESGIEIQSKSSAVSCVETAKRALTVHDARACAAPADVGNHARCTKNGGGKDTSRDADCDLDAQLVAVLSRQDCFSGALAAATAAAPNTVSAEASAAAARAARQTAQMVCIDGRANSHTTNDLDTFAAASSPSAPSPTAIACSPPSSPAAFPSSLPRLVSAKAATASTHASLVRLCFVPAPPIRPLMLNSAIESFEGVGEFDGRALSFSAHSAAALLQMGPSRLEAFCAQLYKLLSGSATAIEKANCLLYLEFLAMDGAMATVLLNSRLGDLIVKLLEAAAAAVRVRAATALALLLRNASFVAASFARGDAIFALADALRDRAEMVRRRSAAALGEALFYMSVQEQQDPRSDSSTRSICERQDQSMCAGVEGSSSVLSAEEQWRLPWEVPAAVTEALLFALRGGGGGGGGGGGSGSGGAKTGAGAGGGGDSVLQHYASKAIENILCSTAQIRVNSVAEAVASAATLDALLTLFANGDSSEPLRISAAVAAAHMLRLRPRLVARIATAQTRSRAFFNAALRALRGSSNKLCLAASTLAVAIAAANLANLTSAAATAPPTASPTPSASAAAAAGMADSASAAGASDCLRETQAPLLAAATCLLRKPRPVLRAKGRLLASALFACGSPLLATEHTLPGEVVHSARDEGEAAADPSRQELISVSMSLSVECVLAYWPRLLLKLHLALSRDLGILLTNPLTLQRQPRQVYLHHHHHHHHHQQQQHEQKTCWQTALSVFSDFNDFDATDVLSFEMSEHVKHQVPLPAAEIVSTLVELAHLKPFRSRHVDEALARSLSAWLLALALASEPAPFDDHSEGAPQAVRLRARASLRCLLPLVRHVAADADIVSSACEIVCAEQGLIAGLCACLQVEDAEVRQHCVRATISILNFYSALPIGARPPSLAPALRTHCLPLAHTLLQSPDSAETSVAITAIGILNDVPAEPAIATLLSSLSLNPLIPPALHRLRNNAQPAHQDTGSSTIADLQRGTGDTASASAAAATSKANANFAVVAPPPALVAALIRAIAEDPSTLITHSDDAGVLSLSQIFIHTHARLHARALAHAPSNPQAHALDSTHAHKPGSPQRTHSPSQTVSVLARDRHNAPDSAQHAHVAHSLRSPLELALDALYLLLCFALRVSRQLGRPPALARFAQLLRSVELLQRIQMEAPTREAEMAAHVLLLLTQLLAPFLPQACCRALLSPSSSSTLLQLLLRPPSPPLGRCALSLLRRLHAADKTAFAAAVAATPPLMRLVEGAMRE